jgi:hypothetical protein
LAYALPEVDLARSALVFLFLLSANTRPAGAFRTHNQPTKGPLEVTYHLLAKEAADETFVSIVEEAFAAWNDVPCSDLRFAYGGTVDEPDYGLNLVFVPRDGSEHNKYCGHPLASKSSGCASGGTSGFTIVLRQVSSHTLAHEIGHVIGLNHAARGSSVMFWSGKAATPLLSADDVRGLCYLFPREGKGRCGAAQDCPYAEGPTTCVNDRCEPGPTGIGGECEEDEDCRRGGCFFTAGLFVSGGGDYRWTEGLCADRCRTRDDCPDEEMCDRNRGLCVPGHQCFDHDDCLFLSKEATCVSTSPRRQTSRCFQPCSRDEDCTADQHCQLDEWTEQMHCKAQPASGGCSMVVAKRPATWLLLLVGCLLACRRGQRR